jgi:membrane associated rhomboid family serine protease
MMRGIDRISGFGFLVYDGGNRLNVRTCFMLLIPLRTDSPLRFTPYMNWVLIVLNVLAFAATQIQPVWGDTFALHPHAPKLYEFFSYQFVHAGIMHIAGNMLFLFIFGNNVNDKMGHVGYLAFYLAGGIVAGIFYMMTEQAGNPIVGASGAIAAVTGAYLILFPHSMVTLFYWFIYFGRIEIQSLWFILAFFAMDLLGNFGGQDGVAHTAHIGGTLFGSAVCLILVATHLLPRDQWDVWALISRWNKRRQYRDLVSRGFNPFDYTQSQRKANQRMDDPTFAMVQELRDRVVTAVSTRQMPAAAELYLQLLKLDPDQVMSRQAQLDIATQLHHDAKYVEAAEAYEKLLKVYPNLERREQVELMVGILYSRYLNNPEQARLHLSFVLARVHEGREVELAREELASLESLSTASSAKAQ